MAHPPAERAIAIETSSRAGSAAVLLGGDVQGTELVGERPHASDLLPLLDDVLRGCGLSPQHGGKLEIDAVFVGTGPGSYTGLRVGIAFALGLVRATGCRIVGVPSTETLAYGELEDGEEAAIVQDARAGRFYYARYLRLGDEVEVKDPPCALPASELRDRLADVGRVLGEERVADAAGLDDATRARLAPAGSPDARSLMALGSRRLIERGPHPPEAVRPLYLREFGRT